MLSYYIDLVISIINFTEGFSSRSSKDPVILPTAPRAARGPGIDEENIPTNPPYVAYISNLPYDVDETDLADFFADMKVCYFCKYLHYLYLMEIVLHFRGLKTYYNKQYYSL